MKPYSICYLAVSLILTSTAHAEDYPFEDSLWAVTSTEADFVNYLGEDALRIKGGYAMISDLELTDGIIEYDIAITPERGFAGAIFRAQDLANYEHFYIRPHQSGNPDANQYTPVINGKSAWQLYHGPGYGEPVTYRYNEWMHIKIAFVADRAEVFIDSDEPVLIINDLKRETAAGGIGVGAANFSAAHFANVSVSPLPDDYAFASNNTEQPDVDYGVVTQWQVSSAFPMVEIDEQLQREQNWMVIDAETTGITNLAQAAGVKGDNNTVIAQLKVHSDKGRRGELAFGYSDIVEIFVNGEPLYAGNNMYESRDYRYLGTIGLFDMLYLPLKEGENVVQFVVSEAFGGWGIQAKFDDLEGISLIYAP